MQRFLIGVYGALQRSGILNLAVPRRVFEAIYGVYKTRVEARNILAARRFVEPGDLVIDVGANIGILTDLFAHWVGPGGRVIAIEPEPANLAALQRRLGGPRRTKTVEIVAAAVSDQVGRAALRVRPDHPGDHHLAAEGGAAADIIEVTSTTIDELLAERGYPCPSIMKIDVQGAEGRVLRGARETLARCHPVVLIEIDPWTLARAGSSEREVFGLLASLGYAPHDLSTGRPLPAGAPLLRAGAEYRDLLFIHPSFSRSGLHGARPADRSVSQEET